MTRPKGYWAREYLRRGFGTLAFADNLRYLKDPLIGKMDKISETLRVTYPEPLVFNFELIKSEAFLKAERFKPNWEWIVMVRALLSNQDFEPSAREIAATKNRIFLETLKQEHERGLMVRPDDYAFPNWDVRENFNFEKGIKRSALTRD
jgi:hypothetical protein